MKYLSTFTGIGGFELGINKAYEDYNRKLFQEKIPEVVLMGRAIVKSKQSRPTCVGYSEINKYADQIYQKHFNTHKNYGDITLINATELPDFDLFVGGFPCQAFSIAGKRGGFDDTRGTLFFDCARILKEKQPRNFILENVKGLLSHDNGRTFKTIINTLTELGYCVEWQVLNAKNFGVPQNRERVFIVGHLGGIPRRKVFPIGKNDSIFNQEIGPNRGRTQAKLSGTLRASGNIKADQTFIVEIPEATKQGYAIAQEGDSINLSVPNSSTRRGRVGKGIAQTIDTGMQQHTLQGSSIRRLTPLECERLMGYPDGWTEGLSDTQRYKTLGNGIVSNVVAEVVKRLYY